jgi:hypothetical protein
LVCFAWVFFRSASIADAFGVLGSLFDVGGGAVSRGDLVLFIGLVALMIASDVVTRRARAPMRVVHRRPVLVGTFVGGAIVSIVLFSGGTPVPFIYFQF